MDGYKKVVKESVERVKGCEENFELFLLGGGVQGALN